MDRIWRELKERERMIHCKKSMFLKEKKKQACGMSEAVDQILAGSKEASVGRALQQ